MEMDQAHHYITLTFIISSTLKFRMSSSNGEKKDYTCNLENSKTIDWYDILRATKIVSTDIVMKITGMTSDSQHSLTMVVNLDNFELKNDNNKLVIRNDKEIEPCIFNEVESGIVIEITPRGKHIVIILSLNYYIIICLFSG
jgi:hypothetical protein